MNRSRVRTTALRTLAAATLALAAMAAPVAAAPAGPKSAGTTSDGEHGAASFRMDRPAGTNNSSGSELQPRALPFPWSFYTLQLNLCNSGVADCYDQNQGRSVAEGIGLIEDKRPDLVTLNEVCWNDVYGPLYAAMGRQWPDEWLFAAFFPAYEPNPGGLEPAEPKTCTNGFEYGSAVIGRSFTDIDDDVPSAGIYHSYYPETRQNQTAGEWRSWGCVDIADTLWACTTHLDSEDEDVAMEQCEYLMYTKLPELQDRWGYLPSIVGGDLNMEYPFVQDCVPSNWWRKGDDDVQHIMYTDDFTFVFTERIEMQYTDHPAWLVAASTPG
jgi:hypothetical protein